MKIKSAFKKAKEIAWNLTGFEETKHPLRNVVIYTTILISGFALVGAVAILTYSIYPLLFAFALIGALAVTKEGGPIFCTMFVAPVLLVGSLVIDAISIPCQLLFKGIKKLFGRKNKKSKNVIEKQKCETKKQAECEKSKVLKESLLDNKNSIQNEVKYETLSTEEKKIEKMKNFNNKKDNFSNDGANYNSENSF